MSTTTHTVYASKVLDRAFAKLVAHLRENIKSGEKAGGVDAENVPLCTGDIVQYYFLPDCETACLEEPKGMNSGIVTSIIIKEEGEYFAFNPDVNGCVYVRRVDGKCRIVGQIDGNTNALRDLIMFRNPMAYLISQMRETMEERAQEQLEEICPIPEVLEIVDFDTMVKRLRDGIPEGVATPYKDVEGTPVCAGYLLHIDVAEQGKEAHRAVVIVMKNKQQEWLAVDIDVERSIGLEHVIEGALVVGSVHGYTEPLKETIRFREPEAWKRFRTIMQNRAKQQQKEQQAQL